jgi:hypothetical protein
MSAALGRPGKVPFIDKSEAPIGEDVQVSNDLEGNLDGPAGEHRQALAAPDPE